jgi:hypothetical protein
MSASREAASTTDEEGNVFDSWVREFTLADRARQEQGDPDWSTGARLAPAVISSIQRFQVGESGDGAHLIAKSEKAETPAYATAVRLFVAEEQNHARLLARLLSASGAPTIPRHWTDTVFVSLRRALGLRLELSVLLVAEIVALPYYRALRDGAGDPLTTEVAARILADEQRHVPFHCQHLKPALIRLPGPARSLIGWAWQVLLAGTATTVALDHGAALRHLGLTRRGFVHDVLDEGRALFTDSPATDRGRPT